MLGFFLADSKSASPWRRACHIAGLFRNVFPDQDRRSDFCHRCPVPLIGSSELACRSNTVCE